MRRDAKIVLRQERMLPHSLLAKSSVKANFPPPPRQTSNALKVVSSGFIAQFGAIRMLIVNLNQQI